MKSALTNPDLSDNVSIVLLCYLGAHGPRRPIELGRQTGLSSSRVTRAIDKLEANGLVRREFGTVAGDRRGTVITLTPEGESDVAAITTAIAGLVNELRTLAREIVQILGD